MSKVIDLVPHLKTVNGKTLANNAKARFEVPSADQIVDFESERKKYYFKSVVRLNEQFYLKL